MKYDNITIQLIVAAKTTVDQIVELSIAYMSEDESDRKPKGTPRIDIID